MQMKLNDIVWNIEFVKASDARLNINGAYTLGATYYEDQSIYIVHKLPVDIFMRVFTHEITHAVIWSYLPPPPTKFTEEDVCNLVAQYFDVISDARNKMNKFILESTPYSEGL